MIRKYKHCKFDLDENIRVVNTYMRQLFVRRNRTFLNYSSFGELDKPHH